MLTFRGDVTETKERGDGFLKIITIKINLKNLGPPPYFLYLIHLYGSEMRREFIFKRSSFFWLNHIFKSTLGRSRWSHVPLIPALRRQRQDDFCEFQIRETLSQPPPKLIIYLYWHTNIFLNEFKFYSHTFIYIYMKHLDTICFKAVLFHKKIIRKEYIHGGQ